MKFYQSPLSICSILLIIAGLFLIGSMFLGAYPTFFFFVVLAIGIVMLLVDVFIRSSALNFYTKLIIQSICIILPLLLVVFYFTEL